RAIEAGADPVHVARRLVAVAAEDVGLADPMALQIAVSALHALQFLGLPEGRLPLAEAAIYLAAAPKSNAVTRAIGAAAASARDDVQHPVPIHLRNATGTLAREAGHGDGYVYAHDTAAGVARMECLPPELRDAIFYSPGSRGFEVKVAERMAANLRHQRGDG
ncbi:MAG: replication-associated recombination protein A, partial [Planctomycetes bacterium]|nr:replication-associated recombination protein A [Planctomycetota bacterium]